MSLSDLLSPGHLFSRKSSAFPRVFSNHLLSGVFVIIQGDDFDLEVVRKYCLRIGLRMAGYYRCAAGMTDILRFREDLQVRLLATLDHTRCDAVMLVVATKQRQTIDGVLDALKPFPISALLVAERLKPKSGDQQKVVFGSITRYELGKPALGDFDRAIKRLFDITVALTALILLGLPMLLTSIAILIESGRPVLFRQDRKGLGGRVFSIMKFRSMTVHDPGQELVQASRKDPRVTPFGRVLRRTSVDELPQLINVLRGEMSMVGPRPHAVMHDNQYDAEIKTYAFRYKMKPGITGWAQIKGFRGETRELSDMEARVVHDLWYINNWSFWLDIKIMFMTGLLVLLDKNAY